MKSCVQPEKAKIPFLRPGPPWKTGRKASTLMIGAAIFRFRNHSVPEVSSSFQTQVTQSSMLPFVCQWNSTPTDRSCHRPGLPMWASRLWGHRVRDVAWRSAVTVLCNQRGQQPGRALSVIAWPPVCEGRQIPFHEAFWHGKQLVQPHIQKHLSGRRKRRGKCRPQGWMWKRRSLWGETFWLIWFGFYGVFTQLSSVLWFIS